jgi:hypothetical protein
VAPDIVLEHSAGRRERLLRRGLQDRVFVPLDHQVFQGDREVNSDLVSDYLAVEPALGRGDGYLNLQNSAAKRGQLLGLSLDQFPIAVTEELCRVDNVNRGLGDKGDGSRPWGGSAVAEAASGWFGRSRHVPSQYRERVEATSDGIVPARH